jgi:DNA-binding MarR family transcriptional regulator
METAELLLGCFKNMRRLVDAELSECGLSLSRARLLSELSTGGPQPQAALAVAFDLAPRTVTELIDSLERDGLVERRTDPGDRRARYVHLTPAGEDVRVQALAIRKRVIDRIMGPLTDKQRSNLFGALASMKVEIDKIDEGAGGTADTSAP